MPAARIALAATLALELAACVGSGAGRGALEARHPQLAAIEGQRLAEVRPYYLPAAGQLTLFLCRWPDAAEIPVHLPSDAAAEERGKLEAALAAWQGAGLGVRFDVRSRDLGGVGIEIELRDGMLAYAANTVVDCAVEAAGIGDDPLPAHVVFASIHLARGDPRLAGTALHELGHALGFQGHPRPAQRWRGRPRPSQTVMARDTEAVRLAGERVLAGKPFADATLAALYALPSGTVLERLPLGEAATRPVDRLLALGRRRAWIGPLLRVGDDEGRLAWLDSADGRAATVHLGALEQARTRPERLAIEPSPRARRLLGEP